MDKDKKSGMERLYSILTGTSGVPINNIDEALDLVKKLEIDHTIKKRDDIIDNIISDEEE